MLFRLLHAIGGTTAFEEMFESLFEPSKYLLYDPTILFLNTRVVKVFLETYAEVFTAPEIGKQTEQ